MSSFFYELKTISYFNDISDKDLIEISSYFEKHFYKKGSYLYYENDSANYVYFIQKGGVELSFVLDDDRVEVISTLKNGDGFGIGEIFFDNYYLNAMTVEDTITLQINKYNFLNHFLKNPSLNLLISKDLALIIKISILNRKFLVGENKILLILSHFAKQSVENNGKFFLGKEATIENISQRINMSREHTSRIMSSLKNKKIIDKINNQIVINKKEFLDMIKTDDIYDSVKF